MILFVPIIRYNKEAIMAEVKKTDIPVIVKKRKANSASKSKEAVNKTTPVNQNSVDTEATIKILFHGSCPKLSARGVGDLEYEIGIDDTADEVHIRIAGNASSGAYSTKWVKLDDVRVILDNIQDESFKAIVLKDLYANQSSSNIGYIGAILKAEGVLVGMDSPPTAMKMGNYALMKKITRLKNDGVNLKDHIAIAAAEKAKKKKASGGKRKVVKEKTVEKM
jgi:hypothetical protein